MKKQIFSAVLTAAMLTSFGAGSLSIQADEIAVGVPQLESLDFLSDITMGFEDALLEGLKNDDLILDEMSAENNTANYASIMNSFVSEGDSLIFTSSDAMLSAALSAAGGLPIVSAGIYDPSLAAGNVAGISALAPYGEQTDLIRTILPDAQSVGIVYSDGNSFSQAQVDGMTTALSNVGLSVNSYAFTDDIEPALTAAADACDVIYIPVDATVTANAETVSLISLQKMKPVITADEATCALCGLAVSTVPAYDLGYEAGELAVRILDGESASSIGIQSPTLRLRKYNENIASVLGILPPDDFESIEIISSIESENDAIEEMTDEQIAAMEAEMEN